MKKLLFLLMSPVLSGCSTLDKNSDFCYFGQCIAYKMLHPGITNASTIEEERRKAEEYGINVEVAIEPIVEDVLERDGNYGLPLNYKIPKHHYHFTVLGFEVNMSKFIEKYPEIVRRHSINNCLNSQDDRADFIHYSTINRIFENSYIFGSQSIGSESYGIVRYDPNHLWKKWPELIETGINAIFN